MKPAKKIEKMHLRRANNRDAEVGRRVRARRLERHLSQGELANKIGVTVPQVQRYEKGASRIGVGRLLRISEALEAPISYFFDNGSKSGTSNESVSRFLQTSGAVRVVKAFHKIRGRKHRIVSPQKGPTSVSLSDIRKAVEDDYAEREAG